MLAGGTAALPGLSERVTELTGFAVAWSSIRSRT